MNEDPKISIKSILAGGSCSKCGVSLQRHLRNGGGGYVDVCSAGCGSDAERIASRAIRLRGVLESLKSPSKGEAEDDE